MDKLCLMDTEKMFMNILLTLDLKYQDLQASKISYLK